MQYKIIDSSTVELKFFGEISYWWISSKDYANTIEEIERLGYKNLNIRTHCYGGSVFEGNVIWVANRKSKLNITFKIDGIAASMMAIVMLSGKRVEMASVAKVMVHPPRSFSGGTAKDHFAEGKLLKSMEKDFVREIVRRTKQTEANAVAMLDGADNWYDAEECVSMGLADAIYDASEFSTEVQSKPDSGTPVDKIFGQYTALGSQPSNHQKPQKMDKKAIIEKFSLTGVTAESSDTAVMDALNAKLQGNESKIKELEQKEAANTASLVDSAISLRETELNTKFTDAQKVTFKTVASTGGLEVLKSVLAEIKPVANLQTLLGGKGSGAGVTGSAIAEDRKNWSFDMWAEKDPEGLSAMEKTNLADFKKLYEAQWPKNEARFE